MRRRLRLLHHKPHRPNAPDSPSFVTEMRNVTNARSLLSKLVIPAHARRCTHGRGRAQTHLAFTVSGYPDQASKSLPLRMVGYFLTSLKRSHRDLDRAA